MGEHATPQISRRIFARAATSAIGVSAMSHALAHASTGDPGFSINRNQDAGEVDILYLYVPWIDKVYPQFEEETGIKVNVVGTYQKNDEWWARINAGEEADFIIGTTDWIQRAMAADLLTPIDVEKIPNIANLDPDFQDNELYRKDDDRYAVPFSRVYYCLTYNTNEFAKAPTSWAACWDDAYKGKITMQDLAMAQVGVAAMLLGDDPLNPTKWDEIRDKLSEQKDLVLKYWTDFQNGMELFANEEAVVGRLTAGRTRMAMANDAPVNWTVPDEGCLTFIDTFAIPKTAKNVDNAHKFINFLERPDIIATQMKMLYYDTFNVKAKEQLDPEFAKQFAVPDDAKLVLVTDIKAETRSRMDELWDEVKLS